MAVPTKDSVNQFQSAIYINIFHDPKRNLVYLFSYSNQTCSFGKTCNTYVHFGLGEMSNFIEDQNVFLAG